MISIVNWIVNIFNASSAYVQENRDLLSKSGEFILSIDSTMYFSGSMFINASYNLNLVDAIAQNLYISNFSVMPTIILYSEMNMQLHYY